MINTRMKETLNRLGMVDEPAKRVLSLKLQELANSQVVELEGCYFLERLLHKPYDVKGALAQSADRADLECSVNEIAVGDYLDDVSAHAPSFLLEQGLLLACALRESLVDEGDFTVILSFEAPGLTEEAGYASCTVQFHANRPDEVSYLNSNLEGYQDAVLVLTTKEQLDNAIASMCESL